MDSLKPATLKKPHFVRLALLGVPERSAAWACLGFCVVLAGLSAFMRFWYGLAILLAVPGYWYSIRWMDKNNGWKK